MNMQAMNNFLVSNNSNDNYYLHTKFTKNAKITQLCGIV